MANLRKVQYLKYDAASQIEDIITAKKVLKKHMDIHEKGAYTIRSRFNQHNKTHWLNSYFLKIIMNLITEPFIVKF